MRINFHIVFLITLLISITFCCSPTLAIDSLNAVFVPNSLSNTVSIIDISTNAIIEDIGVDSTPKVVELSPGGSELYVGCNGKLDIISLSTGQITKRINIDGQVEHMVISPDGNYLYALTGSYVFCIDLRTAMVIDTKSVVDGHNCMALSTDGAKLYVTSKNETAITKVYEYTVSNGLLTFSDSITVTTDIAVLDTYIVYKNLDSDSNHPYLYVMYSSTLESRVVAIDTVTKTINYTSAYDIDKSGYPTSIALLGSSFVGVCSNNVINFLGYSLTYTENVTLSASVQNMILPPWGSTIYVSSVANKIDLIDFNTKTYLGNISVGATPALLTAGRISPEASITTTAQLVQIQVFALRGSVQLDGLNVSLYDKDSNALLYSGITDSSGAVSFTLIPTKTYTINIFGNVTISGYTVGSSINHTTTITPAQSYYGINIPLSEISGLTSVDQQWINQSQLQITAAESINTGTNVGTYNITVSDPSTLTTKVYFELYGYNATGAKTLISSQSTTTLPHTASFSIAEAGGKSYSVTINCTQYNGQNLTHYSAYTFPGEVFLGTIINPQWLFWLALGIFAILAGAGTATKQGLIGLIGTGWGFIALGFGWFRWGFASIGLNAAGADLIMGGVLTCVAVFSILILLGQKEKYG